MNPFDLNDSLDNMVVLVDTREKPTKAAEKRYLQFGCQYERIALNFADYSARFPLPNGSWVTLADKVCIERKQSLDELCHCFCQDRGRFGREFERAKEAGAKMYLLVENATWESAYAGKYRSQMRSTALIASICAWLARYDCQLLMCKPETTGKLIHDVLYREGKEILEHLEVDREDNKTEKLEKAANK